MAPMHTATIPAAVMSKIVVSRMDRERRHAPIS